MIDPPRIRGTRVAARESFPVRLYVYNGAEPFTGPVKTRPTAEQLAAQVPGDEPWHGTPGGYTNHGCKCARCLAAWAELSRKYRAKRRNP